MWYFAMTNIEYLCSGLQAYSSINTSLCGICTPLQKELRWSTYVRTLMPYMRTKSPSWRPSLFLFGYTRSCALLKTYWSTVRCRVADFQGKFGLIIDRRIGKEKGAETAVLANVLSGSGMAQMVLVVFCHLRVASGVTWDNHRIIIHFSVPSPTMRSVQVVMVRLPGKALWDLLEMAPN